MSAWCRGGMARRVAAATTLVLVLAGCVNPFGGSRDDGSAARTATLGITLSGISARSLLPPPLVDDIATYRVTVGNQDESIVREEPAPVDRIEISGVPVGDWTILVEGLDDAALAIASSGVIPVTLSSDGLDVPVTLEPFFSGTGVLELDLSWPAGSIGSITGGIAAFGDPVPLPPFDGAGVTAFARGPFDGSEIGVTIELELPAGYHSLALRLEDTDGNLRRTLLDVAHVHGGRTTVGRWLLTESDLLEPPQPPSAFAASSTEPGVIQLSWNDESLFNSGYRLERSVHGAADFQPVPGFPQDEPARESWRDESVDEGRSYEYRLVALGGEVGDAAPVEVGPVTALRREPDVRYVAPSGSDVTGTGADAYPYASVGRALADLPDDVATEVRLATGTFTETVVVTAPATLRGGYDAADWSAAPDPVANPTTIEGGDAAVAATVEFAVTNPAVGPHGIEGVSVRAASVETDLDERIGVLVSGGAPVLRGVVVEAQNDLSRSPGATAIGIAVRQAGTAAGLTLEDSSVTGNAGGLVDRAYGVVVDDGVSGDILVSGGTVRATTPQSEARAAEAVAVSIGATGGTVTVDGVGLIHGGTAAASATALEVAGTATVTNNTIDGGRVSAVGGEVRGVVALGAATISDNAIDGGEVAAAGAGSSAVVVEDAAVVESNTVSLASHVASGAVRGIVAAGAGASVTANTVTLAQSGATTSAEDAATGVVVAADSVTVRDNEVLSADDPLRTGTQAGIRIMNEPSGVLVANNVIHHRPGADSSSPFYGVWVSSGTQPKIYHNTIVSSDGSAAVFQAVRVGVVAPGEGAFPDLRNNLFASTTGQAGAVGIWIGQAAPQFSSAPAQLQNNGFAGFDASLVGEGSLLDATSTAELNTASITTYRTPSTAQDNVVVTAGGLFVDVGSGDFRLSSTGSGLVGGGAALLADVTVDRDGVVRTVPVSIGAFEENDYAPPEIGDIGVTLTQINPQRVDVAPDGAFPADRDFNDVRVRRYTAMEGWTTVANLDLTVDTFPYSDTTVVPGTTYEYQLTAFNAFGSDSSSTGSITLPPQAWTLVGTRGLSADAVAESDLYIASDANGHPEPVVAYAYDTGSGWALGVERWNGTGWAAVGTLPASAGAVDPVADVAIEPIPDSDGFYVAFKTAAGDLVVAEWDGTGYTTLGSAERIGAGVSLDLALVDTGGGAHTLFRAFDDNVENNGIRLQQFDAGSWTVASGTAVQPLDAATSGNVALEGWSDGTDYRLYLAYHDLVDGTQHTLLVHEYDGSTLALLGSGRTAESHTVRFAFDVYDAGNSGVPYITTEETSGLRLHWYGGGSWQSADPAFGTGFARDLVVFDRDGAPEPFIALDQAFGSAGMYRYDGAEFSGPAVDDGSVNYSVSGTQDLPSLAIFDKEGFPVLYVAASDAGASGALTVHRFE